MPKETESADYLYDFIYADTKRISSYLSQIDPAGVISAIKEIVSEADTLDAAGEINAIIFKAAAKGIGVNSQVLERQFDATPTLPWTLLHLLHDNGYLSDDLALTPVGRMVLVKGELSLIDLKLLREAWRPLNEQWIIETKANLNKIISSKDSSNQEKAQARLNLSEFEARIPIERAGVDLLEKLPHTVNMVHESEQGRCWSALSPANFLFDPEDILLKHGPRMQGIWYLAAIVDAPPESDEGMPGVFGGGQFADILIHISKHLKYKFGRPPEHYAVTPIAIYRAVERPKR